jgi:hypothetical protein
MSCARQPFTRVVGWPPACKNAFALTEGLDSVVLQALRPQDKQAFELQLNPLLTKPA